MTDLAKFPLIEAAYNAVVVGEERPKVWVNLTQRRVYVRGRDGVVRSTFYGDRCPECGDPLSEHGG